MKQLLTEMSDLDARGSLHYVGKLPQDELRSFIRVADIKDNNHLRASRVAGLATFVDDVLRP